MHKQNTNSAGFTIVELLVVVVVIAILAAISIVAYTGIQKRANDSAIQKDIANFAKKNQPAAVDIGKYPEGGGTTTSGGTTGAQHTFPGFTFSPSKSAYSTESLNLFYCTGIETDSGQMIFQIRARSKSGNSFMYKSSSGLRSLGNVSIGSNSSQNCQGIDYPWGVVVWLL